MLKFFPNRGRQLAKKRRIDSGPKSRKLRLNLIGILGIDDTCVLDTQLLLFEDEVVDRRVPFRVDLPGDEELELGRLGGPGWTNPALGSKGHLTWKSEHCGVSMVCLDNSREAAVDVEGERRRAGGNGDLETSLATAMNHLRLLEAELIYWLLSTTLLYKKGRTRKFFFFFFLPPPANEPALATSSPSHSFHLPKLTDRVFNTFRRFLVNEPHHRMYGFARDPPRWNLLFALPGQTPIQSVRQCFSLVHTGANKGEMT